MVNGGCEIRPETSVKSRERDGLNLAFLLLGVVFIRFEIGDDQPLDNCLRRSGSPFAFARKENEFLHAARFQMAQRRPGDFAQIGDGELLGLSCSHQQQLFRRKPLGKMEQKEFERFPGDFAAGGERGEAAVHRAINIAENSVEFVVLVENVSNERVGIYRSIRLGLELDLHVSLSILSASRTGYCFVRFTFGFFSFLGFAAVVEFLALPQRQFAFRQTIPEINL